VSEVISDRLASCWSVTSVLASLILVGKIGQLFGRYAVADLFDFTRLLAVVRLILVPCWDASCQGERMKLTSLRLPQAPRMLISAAYPIAEGPNSRGAQ